jgi:hypothetical protein
MADVLHDPARHEPLRDLAWDERRARAMTEQIVAGAEARWSPDGYWPVHPADLEAGEDPTQPATPLYHGACGVIWALHHLQDVGAAQLSRDYRDGLDPLLARNRGWLATITPDAERDRASYLMGDVPILLLAHRVTPTRALDDRLAALIEGNLDHPARELMWGSPGTMLAALLLHERTGDARWGELFRRTARRLWTQLEWSDEHQCAYWSQQLYGRRSTYLDAVHGFVGTALPLIRGRQLLDPEDWRAWAACIANTVRRTATVVGNRANWRAQLEPPPVMLMQYCHGAPGFVICLAGMPDRSLDELLVQAGEATWAAGPLVKGAGLCHGTSGNGYALLALHRRTGEARWLDRARAFAMHAIEQAEAARRQVGHARFSLWTGDLGLAIYLWDCVRGEARFPTLEV